MTITKSQYNNYMRLKALERGGHVLTTDGLRFIISSCGGDPSKIGKLFLEQYARWVAQNT